MTRGKRKSAQAHIPAMTRFLGESDVSAKK
jgi:hypothetical protein